MQPISKILALFCCLLAVGCTSLRKKNDKKVNAEPTPPKLTRPEDHKIWVPDQIHDNIYETGHWQYVIDKQSVWSKQD